MAVAVAAPSQFLGQIPLLSKKTSFERCILNSVLRLRVKALFWEPKKTVEPTKLNLSIGDFSLTQSGSKGGAANLSETRKLSVSVVSSISEVSSDEWDACSLDATGSKQFNPFLSHGFLSSLEETGCAVKETGWVPQHIIARDEGGNVLGVVPLYLKSHSYGEYVFDHSWADAYHTYGSRYYPKLQSCIPFTPVTGQRILIRNSGYRDQIFDILVSALMALTVKFQVSSLHITFPSADEWDKLKEKGFLQRIGMQYHWKNHNYKSFDEFLNDMKQSKRKNIRQERKKISAQNLTVKRLRGYEIKAKHWDTFYEFYRNTTDNKAIEAAIELNLDKVEAGAQGEHKIQRGYIPVTTYSCHYILDPQFREAIADFLAREATQVKLVMKLLQESGPYKKC